MFDLMMMGFLDITRKVETVTLNLLSYHKYLENI